ncbi:DUF2197 domain-containing protein [Lysinibacillus sp. 1 U-2021]|uniref:DUF2197 domain-containing protein n=1 Tax=Lysinibacillus sp. 1 U-2021 TaxID=3039426 RepID=UPI00247FE614|nr:DUF2197 domain-containing protein [Lysinibacillus sp. 1 U-2021]WGT41064.1 DUF2197 domain-containing protein [Lysinibacillus sp. 1 U-2021]
MQHEAICSSCKKHLKWLKVKKISTNEGTYISPILLGGCKHKIRFDAIQNFFSFY